MAAEDRVVADVDGLAAVAFFFRSVLGLSRDSSTVASAHHHHHHHHKHTGEFITQTDGRASVESMGLMMLKGPLKTDMRHNMR